MTKVVNLQERRNEKMGILPTRVYITNGDGKRHIVKYMTIPFIPAKDTVIFFGAMINNEEKGQYAQVKNCTYDSTNGSMWVSMVASDEVLDNLLESGGFKVFRS